MRLLSRREYGVNELKSRLYRKWPGEEDIEQIIAELVDELVGEGSLSDQRYVQAFVRSRQQRNQGPLKIRAQLKQRELSSELISDALETDTDEWVQLAFEWLVRQNPGELDYNNKARYYRRLLSRGFNHEHAMLALSRYSSG